MIRSTLKYSPLLLSLGLFGCGSSSDSEAPDPRDALTDIELAKNFTQDFVSVKDAITDMQQPLISSVEQFAIDTESVDQDAVEATQSAMSRLIAIAMNTLSDARTEGGIDYSQLEDSYSLNSILTNCPSPCFNEIDILTTANITYSNNTLSVSNAVINSELFEVNKYYEYNPDLGYGYYIEERGESKGTFNSTISFDINLPDPNLEGSNELAFGISNVLSQSNDTQFSLQLNQFGFDGELESTSNLTLNDLIELENTDVITGTSVTFAISEAQLELGAALFIGSATLAIAANETNKSTNVSLSGELINSVGDAIGATIELNETNIVDNTEYDFEYNEEVDYGYSFSDIEHESYDFDYNLEFTFESEAHGDLTVRLTAIGSYLRDYSSIYEYESHEENNTSFGDYDFSLTEMAEGNIQIIVDGKQLNLDYISESQEVESADQEHINGEFDYIYTETAHDMIKITDASYTSRQVYILFNSEDIYTYEFDETLPNGNESETSTESTGVYVDDVQYGELEFDLLDNTSVMVFTDGDEIVLQ